MAHFANTLETLQRSIKKISEEVKNLKEKSSGITEAESPVVGFHGHSLNSSSERIGQASDSLPFVETIPTSLRNNIIQGKNINLAQLLLPHEIEESKFQDSEGKIVILKNSSDNRLLRNLTISEFILAFTKFKNVMCEAYPWRRAELDAYERDIVEMSSMTKGSYAFYEYHKAFSARASALLQQRNIKIDWSIRDMKLYTTIFSGQAVTRCENCNSISHPSHFCPKVKHTSAPNTNRYRSETVMDKKGRPRTYHKGKEICNNFNGNNGCYMNSCNLAHVCTECKQDNHLATKCQKGKQKHENQGNT
ncbi:uncharacterized protein LOC134242104 [Saccostrea cucullata]|uniref:uncharacterized protein LOC134242104 n=1 Tax=Saccostrea cuccullata TaxID=36930 RepID=UPI002ED1FAA9